MTSHPRTFYNFVTVDFIFATAAVYIVLNVIIITLRLFSTWKRHGRLFVGDYCGLAATVSDLHHFRFVTRADPVLACHIRHDYHHVDR